MQYVPALGWGKAIGACVFVWEAALASIKPLSLEGLSVHPQTATCCAFMEVISWPVIHRQLKAKAVRATLAFYPSLGQYLWGVIQSCSVAGYFSSYPQHPYTTLCVLWPSLTCFCVDLLGKNHNGSWRNYHTLFKITIWTHPFSSVRRCPLKLLPEILSL